MIRILRTLIPWVVSCLIQSVGFHHRGQMMCKALSPLLPTSGLGEKGLSLNILVASRPRRQRLQSAGRAAPALLRSVWTLKSGLNLRPPPQVVAQLQLRGRQLWEEKQKTFEVHVGLWKAEKIIRIFIGWEVQRDWCGLRSCDFVSASTFISTCDLRFHGRPDSTWLVLWGRHGRLVLPPESLSRGKLFLTSSVISAQIDTL